MKFVEDETPDWPYEDGVPPTRMDDLGAWEAYEAYETSIAQANDVAPDGDVVEEQTTTPPGMEDLTPEQREQYEATVANAQAAFATLQKIEAAARDWDFNPSGATSIRIKPEDCYVLMGWIVNLQNIGDLLSTQMEAAQAVIGSQAAALEKYEEATGKKLWTPGPVR